MFLGRCFWHVGPKLRWRNLFYSFILCSLTLILTLISLNSFISINANGLRNAPPPVSLYLSLCPEAEQHNSPSRTGVGSDHEDSQTATMGNVNDVVLHKNILLMHAKDCI